jgi:hypothetical protein
MRVCDRRDKWKAMVADDASGMEGGRSERQARKKEDEAEVRCFPGSEGLEPRGRGGSKTTRKGRIKCAYHSNF